ncbi:uncharacterized protein LOC144542738 [Centroberyx gerrardi]
MLGLILMVTFSIIKFKRMKKDLEDPYRENIDIDRHSEGYTNMDGKTSETSEQRRASPQEEKPEADRRRKSRDSETDGTGPGRETVKRDRSHSGTGDRDSDSDESHTSTF